MAGYINRMFETVGVPEKWRAAILILVLCGLLSGCAVVGVVASEDLVLTAPKTSLATGESVQVTVDQRQSWFKKNLRLDSSKVAFGTTSESALVVEPMAKRPASVLTESPAKVRGLTRAWEAATATLASICSQTVRGRPLICRPIRLRCRKMHAVHLCPAALSRSLSKKETKSHTESKHGPVGKT